MEVTFKEYNVDEKPDFHMTWRGIHVLVNDVVVLEIMYAPPHGFAIRDKVIPFRLYKSDMEEVRFFNPTESIKTKEEAKEKAKKVVEEYFNFFR